ncbi:shikimate kinase [Lentilactobacillus kosonis]|uniref:Shikimate kinase n=1 Tax=Lentilactobacillus kosonis TaxID=2810561 RepID=A0A401FP00_9LACO|nr:shikimate kinase [Lentilactobacillus kosonis]GAY73941.1 shikimate kinase I [Lentilactobacillus kosonis]
MDLILVGFMGSGKSTVGKLLAQKLDKEYFDLDELVVQRAGMSIQEIFEQSGEAGFRKIEQQCLRDTEHLSGILSTGGGTPIPENNQQILNKMGAPVVLLAASIETTLARITDSDGRPLVEQLGPSGLNKLFKQRQIAYSQVSDFQIHTDRLSPVEVTEQIMEQFQVVK